MQSLRPAYSTIILAGLLVLIWTALCSTWPRALFLQSDTFWLIEAGRYILEHHRLPDSDIYSFTRAGQPWILYQWLFEVVLALLYRSGGWLALSIFGVVTAGVLFFVVMLGSLARAGANAAVSVLIVGAAAASAVPDLVALRPQLLSFVFMVVLQDRLDGYWQGRLSGRQLWWLVPLMLVWVNVHISFVIAPLVTGIYAVCAYASAIRGQRVNRVPSWGTLAGVAACMLAVTLINPYGAGIYQFLAYTIEDRNITPELRQVDWTARPLLAAYTAVSVLAILGSLRKLTVPQCLAALGFLAAGAAASRFIIYFVLWSAPLAAQALTQLTLPLWQKGKAATLAEKVKTVVLAPAYAWLLAAALALMVVMTPTVFPSSIPVKAAEFLARRAQGVNVFCGEHAGSYLIFRYRGLIPVFIDTRADVYGRNFCQAFRQAMLYGRGWQQIMDRFDIRLALIPARYRLAQEMAGSPSWRLIYRDEAYVILERSHSPS